MFYVIPFILLLEIPLGAVIRTSGWIIALLLDRFIVRQPASAHAHAISV
jgi:hypothetical protein